MVVKLAVERAGVEAHVRIEVQRRAHALGRGDERQAADVLDPGLAEELDGRRKRAAGGEHGVDDQADAVLDVRRELAVVLMRHVRLGVAVHAHVAHARGGDELEQAVHHAEAGAQDRDDGDLLAGEPAAGGDLKRRLHLDVLEREIAHGLIALKDRKLVHELAELLGGRVLVAQDGELVLHERVVDDGEACRVELLCHFCSFPQIGDSPQFT